MALFSLSACQSTIPDADDLVRFEKQATDLTNRQIAILDDQLAAGKINQTQRDERAAALRADIPRKTHELAWARHEIAESEKRAWGVPTGDSGTTVHAPQMGGVSNSFYQPRGEVGSGFGAFQGPNSGAYQRGYSPTSDPSARDRAVPSEVRARREFEQQQFQGGY